MSPIEMEGERYYSSTEAARYLGVSRPTFNKRVKPLLDEYHYGVFQRAYYRESDLDQYKGMRRADEQEDEEE